MRIRGFIILVVSIWLVIYGLAWAFAPDPDPNPDLGSATTSRIKPVSVEWSADPGSLLPKKHIVYAIDTSKIVVTPRRPASQPAQK